ncbi:hypothetical protein HO133_009817 [Letharia lupina]|uniref:Altered inheritance of mitochondria protein 21 n=1 Tax=Letharia lupina TaxID=560253 RepID=A0A8H6FEX2_9LECA|nr:uncharacterized protein HO133_009817 [Letharia lupina]KAF6225815.1 hypothetical protein HO133_009817 [Letharia lupina]
MSVPQVPPRPARSQQQHPNMAAPDIPQIPPRPGERRTLERSQSPNRDSFARSPFHEPPLGMSLGNKSGATYTQNASISNLDLPQRPPSVSLPSIGQEGNEYAEIKYKDESVVAEPEGSGNEPQETRNVGSDLPLHAPRPSFSNSTAKARVSTVTRTDSTQAAAAGIGKALPLVDDKDPQDRVLKPRVSFRTASSASTERPGSAQAEDDRGIPEIGQRVPMHPDAGDVQAPSPSPFQQQFPTAVGFHNSGMQKPSRHHRRTPSGREILPPGSYGMHGHGVPSTDQFERSWYEKHPEALEKEEHGQYGPGIGGGRGEWALSSDDLNKLVRETSRSGSNTPGLPNEQIGYIASEEYASRLNTPASATFHRPLHSNHSQPHVESPLRKQSFPVDAETSYGLEKKDSHASHRLSSEHALESETEDDELYVSPPTVRKSKIHGNGYDPPTVDLGPRGGNTEAVGGFIEERGYGVPILASDEVAKTPEAEYQQPAVSPAQERRGSNYYSGVDSEYQSGFKIGSRSGSASNSRPTSRPGSIYSLPTLSRFSTHDEDRENMHTPLEDVDEYEPLFPDEEGNKRPVTAAERLKLREQMKRFPSKDIWEDTPNSLQLQATVETPEPSNEQSDPFDKAPATVFETPEQESARKGEVSEEEKAKLISREERLAKSNFKPHLRQEMHRPGLAQRFPSRDIWEDSPDSARLETTVGDSQVSDTKSPPDEGLEAGAVVQTSGAPKEGIIAGEQARDGTTAGAAAAKPHIPPRPNKSKVSPPSADLGQAPPSIPVRPPRRVHQVPPADAQVPIVPSRPSAIEAKQPSPTETRKGPILPERPKPQVPVRPAKPVGRDSSESVSLSKTTSISSVGSDGAITKELTSPPPAPKPKPAVPARPAGGKIASLKAGFLSDLDSRLKLGPQGPKAQEKVEPEVEEEKAPLADARKGRAKGPVRRKPAAPTTTESAAAEGQEDKAAARNWQMQKPWTVWEHDGALKVGQQIPSTLGAEAISPEDVSKAAHSPVADSQTDGTDDAKDMHQAKLAVEESLMANEPLTQKEVQAPDAFHAPGASELPTPTAEKANPLSREATPGPSSSSSVLPPTETNTQRQTEEKTTLLNPANKIDKTLTSTNAGEAQGSAEKGDTL